jgi:hypothetical protein
VICIAACALALAVPAAGAAAAAAPKADVLVVGKSATLAGPKRVAVKRARVTVGGKRCRVGAGTPLAALLRMRLDLVVRDYGSCSGDPSAGGGLYVPVIDGEREAGSAGWVYKVGNRVLGTGAGDPSSRVGAGADVLWFWCRSAGACQRTLVVKPASRSVAPGASLRVTVTAYDDNGKGVPGAGATVRLGSASAVAGADGVATLTVPSQAGTLRAVATKAKLVRSFPAEVRVG